MRFKSSLTEALLEDDAELAQTIVTDGPDERQVGKPWPHEVELSYLKYHVSKLKQDKVRGLAAKHPKLVTPIHAMNTDKIANDVAKILQSKGHVVT